MPLDIDGVFIIEYICPRTTQRVYSRKYDSFNPVQQTFQVHCLSCGDDHIVRITDG